MNHTKTLSTTAEHMEWWRTFVEVTDQLKHSPGLRRRLIVEVTEKLAQPLKYCEPHGSVKSSVQYLILMPHFIKN